VNASPLNVSTSVVDIEPSLAAASTNVPAL
jgi:hypothetical protein